MGLMQAVPPTARRSSVSANSRFRNSEPLSENSLSNSQITIPLNLFMALRSVSESQQEKAIVVLKDLLKMAEGREQSVLSKFRDISLAKSFVNDPNRYYVIAEYARNAGFIDFEELF